MRLMMTQKARARVASLFRSILAVLGLMALAGPAHAQEGVTFYIPMPMTEIRTWANVQTVLAENDNLHNVIGITATAEGAILYYDHWEDGFEFDIENPVSPGHNLGAEVWGDQDCSNGYRPNLGTPAACNLNPALDYFKGGDVLVLISDVPVPGGVRDPSQILFDGGDKIFATDLLAVTRGSWPSTGVEAQLGDAVEVFDIQKWGSSYISPVGENTPGAAFDYTAISVMAREDGTTVTIDPDGAGATAATTRTLDQGDSWLFGVDQAVAGDHVQIGATVTATSASGIGTRSVQVNILTADPGSTYEGRFFSLPPTAAWDKSYYAPAGSAFAGREALVYLFNPGPGNLVITEQTLSGTTVLPALAAGTATTRTLPVTNPLSAARYSAASAFYAVTATAPNTTIYDWGHALVPESRLTPAAAVGWAPGSTDLSEDSNPVWVTPVNPAGGTTTVFVDADGDPTTGPNVDADGNHYDVACVVANLRSMRIFDDGPGIPTSAPGGCSGTSCTTPAGSCVIPNGDNDQTGMRIYTRDGTKIAAAWGQDTSLASSNQPQQLDMGTTVVPFSSLNAFKSGTLLVDLNNNGRLDVGDTLLYTTVVRNTGIVPVNLIRVTDTLDANTTYVDGTFEVDGLPVADDTGGGTTAYPLDTDAPHPNGFVLVEAPYPPIIPNGDPAPVYATSLAVAGRITLTYQVVIGAGATNPIVNRVTVSSGTETFVDTASNPIKSSVLEVTKSSNVVGDAVPGQTIQYTVTVSNPSTTPAGVTGLRLFDPLPSGTTYVANSTAVTGPRQQYVADRFGTVTPSYGGSNGPHAWADGPDVDTSPDPWVETEAGTAGPAAGDVQVSIGTGGGQLRLDHQSGGTPNITRLADLTGYSAAGALRTLRFDFTGNGGASLAEVATTIGTNNQDAIAVQCDADGTAPYTTLGYIDWLDGTNGPLLSGTPSFEIPVGCISGSNPTRIRFEVSEYDDANDFFTVDNVEIKAVGDRQNPATDAFATGPPANGGTGWLTAAWTVTGNVDNFNTGGSNRMRMRGGAGQPVATRGANLSSVNGKRPVIAILTFNLTTATNLEAGDDLYVEVNADGGSSFVTLAVFDDDTAANAGFRSFDISPYISATTTIRFRGSSVDDTNDTFYVDNVNIITGGQVSATRDNIPAGANADLANGAPPLLALPADQFALAPGESATATYSVLVNDPQLQTRIVNTVEVSAFEAPQIVQATRIDPVSRGGMVGDRVWLDTDSDGVQDIGEPGLSGVTVELRNGICTPNVNCPRAVTDLNGTYLFDHLKPGSYTVVVISGVPAGLGTPPFPPTQPSVVTTNQAFTNVDFGYVPGAGTAVIGDRVWADSDGDGVQDPGEIGIGGVTVRLRGAGTDGIFGTADDTIVATTTTAPDGSYLFASVAAGQYAVQVETTSGPLLGRTATVGPQSVGASLSPPVSVTAGQVRTDIDFGYNAAGTFSITDSLWVDEDQDTVRDVSERPIDGVTINLVCAAPLTNPPCAAVGNVLATTTSGLDGKFSFTGVPNGSYTLVVTDNAGKLLGRQPTTTDATAGQRAVTVAGASVTGDHFGYAQPGLVGDRVWSDNDGDGIQDPNEPGLGGVTVNLLGPGPDGKLFTADDVQIGTTTTAADGSYEFANLPPGGYRVQVPVQAATTGYTQTGDPNYPNALCSSCDRQGSSTITLGDTDRNVDFGFRDTGRPDISGTVFQDPNRNGVLDVSPPESGLGGVEIALVSAGTDGLFGTADDLVVASTTTAANGTYTFPDVQAGNYQVQVRDGAGVLNGYQLTSGRDQIPITVVNTSITGVDFGYARATATGSVGDTLWIDVDPPGANPPDGLPGPTEPRLPGVTVNLYRDVNGNGVIDAGDGAAIATTVTDLNGQYLFTGLAAGSYLVDVVESTLPDTTPAPGNLQQDLIETTYPSGVNPSRVINLSDGQRYEGADFGYRPRAGTVVLGDFAWFDTDGDGLQDLGEMGIPGIQIQLIGAGPDNNFATTGDNTAFNTTTDADGSYLFTGLPAGMYLATYNQTDVTALGLNNQPTNLPSGQRTFSLTAVAGDVLTTLDFGFNGGAARGSIGDQLWLDVNNNGIQDAGERGLSGVSVNLTDNSGNILATTTTDANGQYRFSGLLAGNYKVRSR